MWIVEFSSECSSTSLGAAFNDNLNQLNTYRNIQQILTTGLKKKMYCSKPTYQRCWLF